MLGINDYGHRELFISPIVSNGDPMVFDGLVCLPQ